MIWDRWYLQPWAWLWSNLERDRLGPGRLLGQMVWSWMVPGVMGGMAVAGAWGEGHFWLGGAIGGGLALVVAAGIPVLVNGVGMARAQRQGWRTVFWVPTSWAVWHQTARVLGVDPAPTVPHWERHTIITAWPGATPTEAARMFQAARRREWHALAAQDAEHPRGVILSHTFSTVGQITLHAGRVRQGTPFRRLASRERRELSRVQRVMFGGAIPLAPGHDVGDPAQWWVVWVPFHDPPQPPGDFVKTSGMPSSGSSPR
ncbi:hypothetical protein [Sulfobacillus thermosulfidooxidans]|uniref:hypothetical protein n=1 Tax=Sulfobacillus thermosulfidooxidans TaxID=28034 RepID=UPI0006B63C3B|nr:hypothetical protein [Sulfobacillus thermosulfidooxidans]